MCYRKAIPPLPKLHCAPALRRKRSDGRTGGRAVRVLPSEKIIDDLLEARVREQSELEEMH
jgi:hypothetical protein